MHGRRGAQFVWKIAEKVRMSAVMPLRLRLGAGKLNADPVVAAPADLGSIANSVDRYVEQEAIGNPGIDRDLQFGATLMLVAHGAADLGILDPGDDSPALEHALAMLAPVLAGLLFEWVCGVRH